MEEAVPGVQISASPASWRPDPAASAVGGGVANMIFCHSAWDVFIYIMTKPEIDPTNILPISLEDLDEEQPREIEQHLKATQEALLAGCFIKTRQGIVRKPGSTPKVTVNEFSYDRFDIYFCCKY
uniref:Uncharacterized protein n=1 Tax=Oryza sativa subsp. japonica TaxID=39947 RepID=Q2QWJ4_ORYSJ|nr:hypothetical protein LOC_Os12g09140 [Oryza sativa Japonica Group]